MSNIKNTVDVQILQHTYTVACSPAEKENLMLAVTKLNSRMEKIKSSSQRASFEKLAVIAALNLANDLVELEQNQAFSTSKLNNLNNRFDLVLAELGNLLGSQK